VSNRRGVVLVVILIVLAVMVSGGAVLLLALLAGAPASVPENAALHVRVEAPFSEIEPSDVLSQFLPQRPTLRQTVDLIRRAKTDARVTALVVRPVAAGPLWGQVQEVRAAIEDFKTSKKPVTAFLESGGAGEYYLASAADRIVLMPAGQLDLVGLASYEVFFRGALDKLGVYPDLLHVGDYKTASNTFTERTFTPAHREMTQSLNRDWLNELVGAVARARRLEESAVRAALDRGPYLADAALAAGLVDELAYEDQLDDKAPLQGTQELDVKRYAEAGPGSAPSGRDGRIALLYAVGVVASGESSFDSPSGMVLGSETFNRWLRRVRVDPDIDAVVVRVDSPGGSAIASEVIWRELMLTRDVKPLVVSMGDVAASGGYYIAAPAHAIVAQPGTLTGSIGVVTGKFVVAGTLDKLGVATGAVSEGRLAEMYSPFRPFSIEERARVEEQLQATYEVFLDRVAKGRSQEAQKIDGIAQGRVWTGRQARELGLVDELGGLDDAIRLAGQRARLDPSKDVDLVVYPPKRSLYEILANPMGPAGAGAGLDLLLRRPEARLVDSAVSTLWRFRRGEPLAIMPNVFLH
jgi:protease-4